MMEQREYWVVIVEGEGLPYNGDCLSQYCMYSQKEACEAALAYTKPCDKISIYKLDINNRENEE